LFIPLRWGSKGLQKSHERTAPLSNKSRNNTIKHCKNKNKKINKKKYAADNNNNNNKQPTNS